MSLTSSKKSAGCDIPTLPNVILHNDPQGNLQDVEDPKIIVGDAEVRARENLKRKARDGKGNDKLLAEELHREADQLHHRGDYEAALVLYHRAASICPRDSSHIVAARRTEMAINVATNPPGNLRKVLPELQNAAQLSANFCLESAAIRAKSILKESTDPIAEIPEILKFMDSRENVLKLANPRFETKLTRSRMILNQVEKISKSILRNIESSFNAGDIRATLEQASELLSLVMPLDSPYYYQVYAYHYIALSQVSINRHDHAVDSVAKMIYVAKMSEDSGLRSMSYVTLGKVHLGFGHLNAAARAWEHLSYDIEEPIPKAWILHEIGRCYLEMSRYKKAFDMSLRCFEKSEEAQSKKWMLHAKLLTGQSLLKLGRFAEAMTALKEAAKITKEEGDSPTLSYIQNLIDEVSKTLNHSLEVYEPTIEIQEILKVSTNDYVLSPKLGLTYRL